MKITKIEPIIIKVNQRGDWIFIQVHTDAGIIGLGEASHNGNDALLVEIVNQWHHLLMGQDPCQIQRIWQPLARLNGGRVHQTAISGLEQALWDILGQSLGVPIHMLFGGAMRDRLRLYANINRHVQERTPEGFARAARQAVSEGFTAIKLAPFDELNSLNHIRTGTKAAWRSGVQRVEAVRAAIGDEIELAVDCHGRMEQSEAIQVGQALASCNLFWYEEPVPDHQIDALAQVTAAVPMPTASAESIFRLENYRPFLTRHVVDVIMPDVKHNGAAARMEQLLVAPHNPSGPVASAATAQVFCTVPNFYILEHAWGEVDWRADLLIPPERIEQGELILSDEPGLGHRLNPDRVEKHERVSASSVDSSKVQTY